MKKGKIIGDENKTEREEETKKAKSESAEEDVSEDELSELEEQVADEKVEELSIEEDKENDSAGSNKGISSDFSSRFREFGTPSEVVSFSSTPESVPSLKRTASSFSELEPSELESWLENVEVSKREDSQRESPLQKDYFTGYDFSKYEAPKRMDDEMKLVDENLVIGKMRTLSFEDVGRGLHARPEENFNFELNPELAQLRREQGSFGGSSDEAYVVKEGSRQGAEPWSPFKKDEREYKI